MKEKKNASEKTVALIGLGAMGAYFAPRMYKTYGEDRFFVIAEGERKERLTKKGVMINGVNYKFPIAEPKETGRKADLIIIATKDMGYQQALLDIKNFVGEDTQILPVLNGIESEEQAAKLYGWDHVLYSYMRTSIVMKDGKADFDPDWGGVHFGEAKNDTKSDRVLEVEEIMKLCKIPYVIDTDMQFGLWFKFMCNIGENMTCALLGIPFGMFRRSENANLIRIAAMREVIAIANAKGIPLSEKNIEEQHPVLMSIPFKNKPSTLQDLESKKSTEAAMFAGTVVKLGKELGIETPVNWLLYTGIRVLEEKNQGMDQE